MTDEQIITLAEKTRKEKYCPQFTEHFGRAIDCSTTCPIAYCDDCNIACGDTIYEQGFLDGFKAAMEYISRSYKTII